MTATEELAAAMRSIEDSRLSRHTHRQALSINLERIEKIDQEKIDLQKTTPILQAKLFRLDNEIEMLKGQIPVLDQRVIKEKATHALELAHIEMKRLQRIASQ